VPQNPAGLIGALKIEWAGGGRLTVLTDATWRSSRTEATGWREASFDDGPWAHAAVIAHYGDAPWGRIGSQQEEPLAPMAAGIPGKVRILYLPVGRAVTVHDLEKGVRYKTAWFNPATGERSASALAEASASGTWTSPEPPEPGHDWALVLEREN
jgi:hypothetical protein